MRSQEPQLATYRFQADDEREAISPSTAPEVHKRKLITLPSSLCKPSLRAYFDWDDRGNDDYANRPALLDLFAGGGGAAMGYYLAGFRVVGIDLHPQPRYPFQFHQADALEFPLDGFDVIHASPPCQEYSITKSLKTKTYPDLIGPVRERLIDSGYPYVIENVCGAPLIRPLMLCGTMFGLRVIRHRLFEINPEIILLFYPQCAHRGRTQKNSRDRGKYAQTPSLATSEYLTITGHDYIAESGRMAMGISWMTKRELSQAIPPAYTEWIGKQLIQRLADAAPKAEYYE